MHRAFLWVLWRCPSLPFCWEYLTYNSLDTSGCILLAIHLRCISKPLRSYRTYPACFAEVPMCRQYLRQLLTRSPCNVALKFDPPDTNLFVEGVKLLPNLQLLVLFCQLLTPAFFFLEFSGMSQTHSRGHKLSSLSCLIKISFLGLKQRRSGIGLIEHQQLFLNRYSLHLQLKILFMLLSNWYLSFFD